MKYNQALKYIKGGSLIYRENWNNIYIFIGSYKGKRCLIKFDSSSNVTHKRYIPSIGDIFAGNWKVVRIGSDKNDSYSMGIVSG